MTAPTLSPQIVGRAENAHRPVLARILAGTGITGDQWVALTLAAAAGGALDRDQLAGRVADALKLDPAAAGTAIAGLTAGPLLADLPGARVGLTATGEDRYRRLRAAVDEVVARAYRDIPAEDLATAGRVLTLITARLNAETA